MSKINQDKFIINLKYMMEKEPTFENKENFEQRLVRLLKEMKQKEVEDPEVMKLLHDWTCEQEKRVEQSTGDNYNIAQIQFNLKRARLYFEAGYTDEAFENFEAARMQAWNEQRDKLFQEIMQEMDRIEESMENQK